MSKTSSSSHWVQVWEQEFFCAVNCIMEQAGVRVRLDTRLCADGRSRRSSCTPPGRWNARSADTELRQSGSGCLAVIAARIDRLEPAAKRALNAAAVIGSQFRPDLLRALGIDPTLEDLLRAELVDQTAFTLAQENKMDLVVFGLHPEGNVLRVAQGEKIGTLVTSA